MTSSPLSRRPKILAYWIARKHHLFEEIALKTNKKYDSVYLQLRRGNPRWKDQGLYADALASILGIGRINETTLFSEANEDEAVRFLSSIFNTPASFVVAK